MVNAMNTGGPNRAERRLAAILAADVAGYSRLIGADEEGTLTQLRAIRAEVIDPRIAEHHGRLVKTTGDGLLVEFASVVDALRCASEMQQAMAGRNAGIAVAERIDFRIGINVGDVVVEDGDIFGDGVNVAARLEGLAEPGGICVSARVQEDAAGRLDLVFEDLGEQNLKNIARPARVYRVGPPASGRHAGGTPAVQSAALPLPDKPSIAVLPFQNMSGDPEQEYFVDGMVEEIITALSRIRWLFVIARNSTFTYKGRAVDVKQVGRELGVRYVLEGSVRKGGSRVRITAQLIDAATGAHLWADRFDGTVDEVFELQDEVAVKVAGVIEPALQADEVRRSSERAPQDQTAYDLYLRALVNFPWTSKEQLFEARDLLDAAIARDPRYGPALGWAAVCCARFIYDGFTTDHAAHRRIALALVEQALAVGYDDPGVLTNAAHALTLCGDDSNAAIRLVDRALALNPSHARGWYVSGFLRSRAGRYDEAVEHLERSLRLSPRGYLAGPRLILGGVHFFNRRFEQAAESLASSLREVPLAICYRLLASCYAHMGRIDEARTLVEHLRGIGAEIVPTHSPYARNPAQNELFLSGLRLAVGETE
jgi:TolB-like protein/class 3 adenylate cyclase